MILKIFSSAQVENFCRIRSWPILDTPSVMDQLIRAGVSRGIWCLFRMGSDDSTRPDEFYSRETGELPFGIDFDKDFSIVTVEGARKRGWIKESGPDLSRIQNWVRQTTGEKQVAMVSEIAETVTKNFGQVTLKALNEAVSKLVQENRIMTYKGRIDQEEKPDLISGTSAIFYNPEPDDIIITPARAAEKGWITEKDKTFSLSGKEGAKILLPLLRKIGSFYQRGGRTDLDMLDLVELDLPKGGTLRITLSNVPSDSMKELGELFEVVAGIVQMGEGTEAYLDISDPKDDCPFIQELRKSSKK